MSGWHQRGSAWDDDGPQGTEESNSWSGHGNRNVWQDRSSSSDGNGWQDASSGTGQGWQDSSSSTGNSWHGGGKGACLGLGKGDMGLGYDPGKGMGPGYGLGNGVGHGLCPSPAGLGDPWYAWTAETIHAWQLGKGKGATAGYIWALAQFNAQTQLPPGGVGQAKVEDLSLIHI